MSNKKTWGLFMLFFLLSFSLINFNFEHVSYDDETAKKRMIEDFVSNQVSDEQINTKTPVKWRSPLLYSIDFYGDGLTSKKRERLTEKLLIDLSAVTGLPLKRVESEKANLKFIFSPDWRDSLIKHYPEIKLSRKNTLDMNDEEYKNFWMAKRQNTYVFRGINTDSHEIVSATLFFNIEFKNYNCEMSVNIARALMLPPKKEFSYTNTCLKDKLPVFEESFLKVFYSKKYSDFIGVPASRNKEQIEVFFVDEIMDSIDKSIKFSKK